MTLMQRWPVLLEQLGEEWIPRTPLVMSMGAAALGRGELPANTTLPEWEAEMAASTGPRGDRRTWSAAR